MVVLVDCDDYDGVNGGHGYRNRNEENLSPWHRGKSF